MNMMEKLKLIVDMVAIRSRILGHEWKFVGSPPLKIRHDKACPLKYISKADSWIEAEHELGLNHVDESTGGRESAFTTFLRAADGDAIAREDINSPSYKLRQHMIATLRIGLMLFLVLVPGLASAQMVTLPNGQTVPCNHPLAGNACAPQPVIQVLTPAPELPPVIAPPPPPYQGDPKPFKLGRTYTRSGDGQTIFVAGIGQTSFGWQVWFMECRNTAFAEKCPVVGATWVVFANTTADGWVEVQ